MKINTIDLFNIRIPFQEPFRISSGVVSDANSLIIRLQTDEGYISYGEAAPMDGSFYSYESPEHTWRYLSEFLPSLIGKEFVKVDDFPIKSLNSSFAQAAVETALWDLVAQDKQVPLYKLFGSTRRQVECGLAVGIYDSMDELLASIAAYIERGYRRVKIKIKPGWDVEPVRQIRKTFGDIPLFVDANASYSIADLDVFRKLDEFNLLMYEQPFAANAWHEHAELANQVQTPICLDEGVKTPEEAKLIIKLGSAEIINIKLQRVGGFGPALEIYELCRNAGLDLWCGSMPELGVGQIAGLHLATLAGFNYPTDLGPSLRFFKDDLVEPYLEMDQNGLISVPDGAGMGLVVNQTKLEHYTVRRRRWKRDLSVVNY